jgi:hypothetical protein
LIIEYDGQSYPFDLDDVTVKQALKIEQYMKCSFAEWGKLLQASEDMRARQTLGWLILTEGDLTAEIGDTDFKLVALGKALDEAFAAAAAPEAEPVPTVAAESNGHAPAAAASSLPSSPPSWDAI